MGFFYVWQFLINGHPFVQIGCLLFFEDASKPYGWERTGRPNRCVSERALPAAFFRACFCAEGGFFTSSDTQEFIMSKRTIWQNEHEEPTLFCMVVSAVVGIGGFYGFFILMAILEELIHG